MKSGYMLLRIAKRTGEGANKVKKNSETRSQLKKKI